MATARATTTTIATAMPGQLGSIFSMTVGVVGAVEVDVTVGGSLVAGGDVGGGVVVGGAVVGGTVAGGVVDAGGVVAGGVVVG